MSQVESLIPGVLQQYGLDPQAFKISRLGSGHIHHTFKLTGAGYYILQQVNKNVFKKPEVIADNIAAAAAYLRANFPDFLFLTPRPTRAGDQMTYDETGYPWRMFDFIEHTFTIDKVASPEQAFSAAAAFGKLAKNLSGVDVSVFKPTIERFHDLVWRWEQFEQALSNASADRLGKATSAVQMAQKFSKLVDEYRSLVSSGKLQLRITHNDTKINNVLFDERTNTAVCAIDLDTLMPGYFIYDLGDMIRTFVSPVDEEEKDFAKISVRKNIYDALVQGYLSEMQGKLSADELASVSFSGKMMTYIMALRMLTDFLNGDVYYHTIYPGQNLVRATNQFTLLQALVNIS